MIRRLYRDLPSSSTSANSARRSCREAGSLQRMRLLLGACWLLAAAALKVSHPEVPTRHAPSDECKRRTALLQQAALQNDAVALRALLEREEGVDAEDGWSADGLGANGYTALIVAANNGHLAAASVLCEHGASADARGKAALTALHAAAGQGHVAMVDALCARGASVDLVTELDP